MEYLKTAIEIVAWLLQFRFVQGALTGWVIALRIDYAAFVSWKNWHGPMEYDWATAVWRWVQGAVIGALAGAGFGALG